MIKTAVAEKTKTKTIWSYYVNKQQRVIWKIFNVNKWAASEALKSQTQKI